MGDKSIELLGEYSGRNDVSFAVAVKRWREAGVEERAGGAIEEFQYLLGGLVTDLIEHKTLTAGNALLAIFEKMGYRSYIEKLAGNALVATKRWRVLEIFSGILDRYMETGGRNSDSLKEFIDAMELRDALNTRKENEDRVQLLTLHSCKGLEFPIVYLMGVEEDILPHKVLGTDVSEERRLFLRRGDARQTKIDSNARKKTKKIREVDRLDSFEISPRNPRRAATGTRGPASGTRGTTQVDGCRPVQKTRRVGSLGSAKTVIVVPSGVKIPLFRGDFVIFF